MLKYLILLLVLIQHHLSTAQSDSLEARSIQWSISGELGGAALGRSGYGEIIIPRKKFDLSFRIGAGKIGLPNDGSPKDNLSFPHIITWNYQVINKSKLWLELGAGGSFDFFYDEQRLWNGNVWEVKQELDASYRLVPVIFGFRKVNSFGLLSRVYTSINMVGRDFILPMIGGAIGYVF